jgi:hypothetical protein
MRQIHFNHSLAKITAGHKLLLAIIRMIKSEYSQYLSSNGSTFVPPSPQIEDQPLIDSVR